MTALDNLFIKGRFRKEVLKDLSVMCGIETFNIDTFKVQDIMNFINENYDNNFELMCFEDYLKYLQLKEANIFEDVNKLLIDFDNKILEMIEDVICGLFAYKLCKHFHN